MVDYDKYLSIQIGDTGRINLSDVITVLSPIDFFNIYGITINEEGNVNITEQSSLRNSETSEFEFDYQTNTRNGIMPPRYTIRGIIKSEDSNTIKLLKQLRVRDTIKKLKGGISLIKEDINTVQEGSDVFIYVQIANLTFTEDAGSPDTTRFTLQLQQVNQ